MQGSNSDKLYGPFIAQSLNNGTYQVDFLFRDVDAYTIYVKLGNINIFGSPISNVLVSANDVQALNSVLLQQKPIFEAG